MAASEEALAEVALDNLPGIADGSQVGPRVPFEQQIEILQDLCKDSSRDPRQIGR